MGNFQGGGNRGGGFRGGNGGGFGGGKPNFRGGDRGGNRDNPMHKTVCSECDKSCEVPFRPSGDKPVYCNDCFSTRRGQEGNAPRKDFGDRGPKRDFNDRQAPRNDFKAAPSNDETKKQLSDISMKLDRLLSAIEKMADVKKESPVAKVSPTVAPVKKVEVKKVVTKVAPKKVAEVKAPKKKVVIKKKK